MKSFLYSVLGLLLVAAAGCTVPGMRVSEGLRQEATVLPVVGRPAVRVSLGKEKAFRFGAYQLNDIRRGWTHRSGNGEMSHIQVTEAYQKYSFGVTDSVQQKTWFVQAAAMFQGASVAASGWSFNLNRQRETLKVAFKSEQSGVWFLSLADPGHYMQRLNFTGSLNNGKDEIQVQPVYTWEGKIFPSDLPIGYEFSVDGKVLASVQTMNQEKVWLKDSLSPDLKMVLASACASLLLYNKLEDTTP